MPKAGTGKSFLTKFIVQELNIDNEFIAYIAYTGKAASVLQSKVSAIATTAHKLLYDTKPLEDGTFIHVPKSDLGKLKLIVVDEISMLPKTMWELLLSYGVYVLALGDPF